MGKRALGRGGQPLGLEAWLSAGTTNCKRTAVPVLRPRKGRQFPCLKARGRGWDNLKGHLSPLPLCTRGHVPQGLSNCLIPRLFFISSFFPPLKVPHFYFKNGMFPWPWNACLWPLWSLGLCESSGAKLIQGRGWVFLAALWHVPDVLCGQGAGTGGEAEQGPSLALQLPDLAAIQRDPAKCYFLNTLSFHNNLTTLLSFTSALKKGNWTPSG